MSISLLRKGGTESRGISAGGIFELTDYPRKDRNRKYLVTGASYQVQAEQRESGMACQASIHCSFEAIPDDVHFRPARITPRPVIQGPHTADSGSAGGAGARAVGGWFVGGRITPFCQIHEVADLTPQENAGPPQVFLSPAGGGLGAARSWGCS